MSLLLKLSLLLLVLLQALLALVRGQLAVRGPLRHVVSLDRATTLVGGLGTNGSGLRQILGVVSPCVVARGHAGSVLALSRGLALNGILVLPVAYVAVVLHVGVH